MKQTVSAKETEWSPFPTRCAGSGWRWVGDWGIGQTQEGFVPRNPTEFLLGFISWPLLKFLLSTSFTCCFPYFVFFVHLSIFAFFPAVSFSLSVLLFDSFLANTVIGPFKKQATFFPFQWDTRGGKVVWCKSFFLNPSTILWIPTLFSKCWSVICGRNSTAFYPCLWHWITALLFWGRGFIYLFVLICSHFCDSQFLFSVVNHTTVWIFMKLSHSFRPEYWHFPNFCHKVEQQVLFPS